MPPEQQEERGPRPVREYREQKHSAYAVEWYRYHHAQADRIEKLAQELAEQHRAKAEALLDEEVARF